jgi:hypothetical protein
MSDFHVGLLFAATVHFWNSGSGISTRFFPFLNEFRFVGCCDNLPDFLNDKNYATK